MRNFFMICANCGMKGKVTIAFNTDKPTEIEAYCMTCKRKEKQNLSKKDNN